MSDPSSKRPYSFSFTAGALFVPETLTIAQKFLQTPDWKSVSNAVRDQNLLRQRTIASTTRIFREIRHRLVELSLPEMAFLVTADASNQRLLLYVAVCRRYRFIREFTSEILWDKIQAADTELHPAEFTRFIEDKEMVSPEIERLTDHSRAKARQVILRILAESGLIDSTLNRKLLRPFPSRALAKLIAEKDSKQLRWLLLSDQEILHVTR